MHHERLQSSSYKHFKPTDVTFCSHTCTKTDNLYWHLTLETIVQRCLVLGITLSLLNME